MTKARRLDNLLVDLGLVETRNKAQALIIAGQVLVDGQRQSKPGHAVNQDARVELLGPSSPFVSRGGEKLAGALDYFKLIVQGWTVVDCGISTGGFTDCLLQRGAKEVFGIDVGYGEVAWKIRQDPRVRLFEKTNLRYFDLGQLPMPVDLVTMDLSFISITKVLPMVAKMLKPRGIFLPLVKPQFEVGRAKVGKGGVVRTVADQLAAVESVIAAARDHGFVVLDQVASSLRGAKGNQEYFVYFQKAT